MRMAPSVAASGCTRRRLASECAVPLTLEGVEVVSFELGNVEMTSIVLGDRLARVARILFDAIDAPSTAAAMRSLN